MQTHIGTGRQLKRTLEHTLEPIRSVDLSASEDLSEKLFSKWVWEMVEGIRATTENFQYILDHLNGWLANLGANAAIIRELCEGWSILQDVRIS